MLVPETGSDLIRVPPATAIKLPQGRRKEGRHFLYATRGFTGRGQIFHNLFSCIYFHVKKATLSGCSRARTQTTKVGALSVWRTNFRHKYGTLALSVCLGVWYETHNLISKCFLLKMQRIAATTSARPGGSGACSSVIACFGFCTLLHFHRGFGFEGFLCSLSFAVCSRFLMLSCAVV